MEKEKEINISIPEGYEIDKEKSTFEKIIFKKVENLPMSFDEMTITDYWYNYNYGISNNKYNVYHTGKCFGAPIYPTKEYAEAFWALSKLVWLRDAWNKGWKPNWKSDNKKYIIAVIDNEIKVHDCYNVQELLVFEKQEVRDKFFHQFKDLLEIAKPLL